MVDDTEACFVPVKLLFQYVGVESNEENQVTDDVQSFIISAASQKIIQFDCF